MLRLSALFVALVLNLPAAAQAPPAAPADPVVLVVHGGAGTIRRADLTPEQDAAVRAALAEALRAGHAQLTAGAGALDAVEAAIVVLEESPLFNAGRGGVFAADGTVRHDASVMDGRTGLAGGATGTMRVRSPVRLARRVMEASPHVLLSGDGAEEFAIEQGLELVPNRYFHVESRRRAMRAVQDREGSASGSLRPEPWQMTGTVGAVALDARGALAAGTSTGGMTNKRWGRIGDAPVIGAGTYADARVGVSATGHGEFFLRLGVARDIAARAEYLGESLEAAAGHVIARTLTAAGGTGGVVALDAQGRAAMPFNTEGMYRGQITRAGVVTTAIYTDEG